MMLGETVRGIPLQIDSVVLDVSRCVRRMLNADLSCVVLLDREADEIVFTVPDGTMSTGLEGLRTPAGANFAGQVIEFGAPLIIRNVLADRSIPHHRPTDAVLAVEDVRSVLCVPLSRDEQVIGAIVVARRSERDFVATDLTFLNVVAAHTASVIEGQKIRRATRVALRGLINSYENLYEYVRGLERVVDVHRRINRRLLDGGIVALFGDDCNDVGQVLAGILGAEVVLYNNDGRMLISTGRKTALTEEVRVQAERTARHGGETVNLADCWIAPVNSGREHLGAVVLRLDELPVEESREIVERSSLMAVAALLYRRAAADIENRVCGGLLDDLIASRIGDTEHLRERARLLGRDVDTPYVMVVVQAVEKVDERAVLWASYYAGCHRGLATKHNGRLVLMLPGDDPRVLANEAIEDCNRSFCRSATAGASGPITLVQSVGNAYRDATTCLDAMLALGCTGQALTRKDLGFVGLIAGGKPDIGHFVSSMIGPIIDYDARRGTELRTTLQTYLESGQNGSQTAKKLYIHLNTVSQRLDRIGALLGEEWQSSTRILDIHLALRLHTLRRELTQISTDASDG